MVVIETPVSRDKLSEIRLANGLFVVFGACSQTKQIKFYMGAGAFVHSSVHNGERRARSHVHIQLNNSASRLVLVAAEYGRAGDCNK